MRGACFLLSFFVLIFSPAEGFAGAVPRRVVSLYPGHTDNIVALGAGDRLVGVPEGEPDDLAARSLPPDARRLPTKAGPELILSLRPDAVILRPLVAQLNPHLAGALERAGVDVYVIDPPSWEEFGDYLARLAGILGTDPEAARTRLRDSRAAIEQSAAEASRGKKKPVVFLEATSKELHTCAPNSWAARLIELAGGINAASDAIPLREGSALAPWGVERVLEAAESAGLDVYLAQQGPMNAALPEEIRARPWFAALNARLAAVPESRLSRPSLLGLEEGGKALIHIFYGAENSGSGANAQKSPGEAGGSIEKVNR